MSRAYGSWSGDKVRSEVKGRSRDKIRSGDNVNKCLVRHMVPSTTIRRAGVIIYTVYRGCAYFGLGLDSASHDPTDFGGSVRDRDRYRDGEQESALRAALREFDEESLGIFESVTVDEIQDCPVVYGERDLVVFVHLDVNPHTVCEKFNAKHRSILDRHGDMRTIMTWSEPEMCAIVWLTLDEMKESVSSMGILYERVRRLLYRAGDFYSLL
jgi:hypothetical protein